MKYGYARVAGNDHSSVAAQSDILVEAGAEEIHFDSNVSGSLPAHERTGWATLDRKLEDGDIVVVCSLDRLGRTPDVLTTLAGLEERGVQVVSVRDGIDNSTEAGVARLRTLAELAQIGVVPLRTLAEFAQMEADAEHRSWKVRAAHRPRPALPGSLS